jgi:hypothetical protein
MEVPFVAGGERLDAVADGVFGEFFKVGDPVGVDAPIGFEKAAHPIEGLRSALFGGKFYAVMEADEAGAAVHFFGDLGEVIGGEHGVTATAISVKEDGIGLGEFFGGRPFGVEMHGGFYGEATGIETFFEEENSGVVFVFTGAVGGATREEEEVFGGGICGESGGEREEEGGEEGGDFHKGDGSREMDIGRSVAWVKRDGERKLEKIKGSGARGVGRRGE